MTNEVVHFRLIQMPCCKHLYCRVNPRLPNFCPECGASVYGRLMADPSCIKVSDEHAKIAYRETA